MVKYINPEMEVVALETEDVILASGGMTEEGDNDMGGVDI